MRLPQLAWIGQVAFQLSRQDVDASFLVAEVEGGDRGFAPVAVAVHCQRLYLDQQARVPPAPYGVWQAIAGCEAASCFSAVASSSDRTHSAPRLPEISMPPNVGPMRGRPKTVETAMPMTTRPG